MLDGRTGGESGRPCPGKSKPRPPGGSLSRGLLRKPRAVRAAPEAVEVLQCPLLLSEAVLRQGNRDARAADGPGRRADFAGDHGGLGAIALCTDGD